MVDKDKILKNFGERLRAARMRGGLTQEEVALELGFDRTYIGLLERGKRNPSLFTIHKLAILLDVSASSLV